jgi:large subunit ribosomal protein L32
MNSRLFAASLSICAQCKKPALPHRVCPHCGYYKGKPVVVIETREEKRDKRA